MRVSGIVLAVLGCTRAHAKAVFAHFMVENAKEWSVDAWKVDIKLAQQAHIDGFALNIRQDDASLGNSLGTAFEAADSLGFKMIFSYDYAGGGPWSANRVIQLTQNYGAYSSYYHDEEGRPLVSTFEGPANAKDWEYIIQKTNALFLPDWSSLGAKNALAAAPCVPHGLFSWAPWPWGNTDSNTYVDASYLEFLDTAARNCGSDMKYMMPASPWFYTNLPGYKKNWTWRGDDLWFARWEQIRFLNPDYVQIISWNDFGESHHIGPLYVEGDSYEAFTVGQAPFNYALDMPHDGWRDLLPFTIDLYKTGVATVSQEKLVAWYRVTSSQVGCDDGWTTGNTVSQLQLEFWPHEVAQDKIFYSALLAEDKPVTVSVGGVNLNAKWDRVPSGGIGIYHGSAEFGRNVGNVVISVGSMTLDKRPIAGDCGSTSGYTNWNAFVASTAGETLSVKVDTTKWVCIEGTAAVGFDELCEFTCKYGYCPPGACYCTKMGPGIKEPDADTPGFGTIGYPVQGKSASYKGLCTFSCNLGFCPSEHCGTTEYPTVVPTVSPFTPHACTSGTGEGAIEGLCNFSCNFGFCPIHSCTCSSTGPLHDAPAQSETVSGKSAEGVDARLYNPLCEFACSRGYCPQGTCTQVKLDDSNPDPDNVVYVGTQVYAHPTAACESPCVLVLPPKPLGSTTTIFIPPYTTSLEVGKTTTTITLSPTPVTTDTINFSNVNITGSITSGDRFPTCTSLVLDPVAVTLTYVTDAGTTITTRDIQLPPWPQMTQGSPQKWTSTCGGFLTGGNDNDDEEGPILTPTQTTTSPLPTYTDEFPPTDVEPILEPLDNQCSGRQCTGDPEDNSIKVKCDELWFFNLCINTDRLKVFGWKFIFPPGIIGPLPPPLGLGLDGWDIVIPPPILPPWPRITVLPGPRLTYPEKPASCDDNKIEVPVPIFTMSYGLSISNGLTITTTTRTMTETAYETGCPLPEYTTTAACSLPLKRVAAPTDTPEVQRRADPAWADDMTCPGGEGDSVLYYKRSHKPHQVEQVLDRLEATGLVYHAYTHSSPSIGEIFVYIEDLPRSLREKLNIMPGVLKCYSWQFFREEIINNQAPRGVVGSRHSADAVNSSIHERRAETEPIIDPAWHRSQIASAPGEDWSPEGIWYAPERTYLHEYFHDDTLGQGQYIYVYEDGVTDGFKAKAKDNLELISLEYPMRGGDASVDHGTLVGSFAISSSGGIAPKATMVTFDGSIQLTGTVRYEKILAGLLAIIKDIENVDEDKGREGRQGKCVVNISSGVSFLAAYVPGFRRQFQILLKHLQNPLGCVVVLAAGNYDDGFAYSDHWLPQAFKFQELIPDLMIIGGSGLYGKRSLNSLPWSDGTDSGMVYAPGLMLELGSDTDIYGTSFAAPQVAGLSAYLRGLDSPYAQDFRDPIVLVKMIRYLSRKVKAVDTRVPSPSRPPKAGDVAEQPDRPVRVVWNGNVGKENCFTGYSTELARKICDQYMLPLPPPGSLASWIPDYGVSDRLWAGGAGGSQEDITWEEGPASPTCEADCGTLCTGYYCVAKPTGSPPDFGDPVNSPGVTSTTTARPATTVPPSPPAPTEKPEPEPPVVPSADCYYWDKILFYTFEIYNMVGWADDGGDKLRDEMNGCGAITNWDWYEQGGTTFKRVWFNLPLFIKDGCVERAIVSAGGPKLSCVGKGLEDGPRKKRDLDVGKAAKALPLTVPATTKPIPVAPSLPERTAGPSYSYGTTPLSHSYSPLWWSSESQLAVTTTVGSSNLDSSTRGFETLVRRTDT